MFLYKWNETKRTLTKKEKKTSKVPFLHKEITFTTNKKPTRSLKLERQSLVVLKAL
jgi:hypothetical protein